MPPNQPNTIQESESLNLLSYILNPQNIIHCILGLFIIKLWYKFICAAVDIGNPAINEFAREVQRNAREYRRQQQLTQLLAETKDSELIAELRSLVIPRLTKIENLAIELKDPITCDWIIDPVYIKPNDKQLLSRNTLKAWEIESKRLRRSETTLHILDGTPYTSEAITHADDIFEQKARKLISKCRAYTDEQTTDHLSPGYRSGTRIPR